MEELIEKITEIYFEKKEKIEELNHELTEIYEERMLINEIIRFVQSCGIQTLEDIDKEIEKYNVKIREVASYNTNNLKDEKKIALERIKELKKYKEYIEKNNRNNKEINELLNELKTKSIKRTNEQHKQQTQLLPIIRNLIEVCDDKIIELKHENGESVDLSTKFSMLDFVQKRINSFDIYNGILSKKNQHELEQLEEKKKMIIEDIKGIIPDLGAMIRDSIEQEMYDKKRVEASEKLKDNKLKISQLTSIKQNLKGIEKSLLENPFYGLIRKINEQENNIKKIEMKPKDSVIEEEPLKFKGPELSQKLTEQIEKIVLGLPKNMNNTIGESAERCLNFKKQIEETLNIEVIMQDERLTTVEATNYMIEANMSRKKRKKKIDSIAANIILQTYLDRKKD